MKIAKDVIKNGKLHIQCRRCKESITISQINCGMVKIECPKCKISYYVDSTGNMSELKQYGGLIDHFSKGKMYAYCRNSACKALMRIEDTSSEMVYTYCPKCSKKQLIDTTAQMRDLKKNAGSAKATSQPKTQSQTKTQPKPQPKVQPQQGAQINIPKINIPKMNIPKPSMQQIPIPTPKPQPAAQPSNLPKVRKVHFWWGGEENNDNHKLMGALKAGQPVHPMIDGVVYDDIRQKDIDVSISAAEQTIGAGMKIWGNIQSQSSVTVPAGNGDFTACIRMVCGKADISGAPDNSTFIPAVIKYVQNMVNSRQFAQKFGNDNLDKRVEIRVEENFIRVQYHPVQTRGIGEWSTGYRTDKILYSNIGIQKPAQNVYAECKYANVLLLDLLPNNQPYYVGGSEGDYIILKK